MRRQDDELITLLISPDTLMGYVTRKWREEQESKPLTLNSSLSAALNKCPGHWINGICLNLGLDPKGLRKKKNKVQAIVAHLTNPTRLRQVVDELSTISREALSYILEKGGWGRIGPLHRRFGDEEDVGWFWADDEPAASPLGSLRVRGLLFVGRAGIKGRNYTVAVIPKELRELLKELLAGQSV